MSSLDALAAAGVGIASALLPVINAEAYLGVTGLAAPSAVFTVALALALGQTAGKVVLFEGAKRSALLAARRREPQHRRPRFGASVTLRLTTLLRRPWLGGVTVLVSASAGVPPLAVVSVLAGHTGVHRAVFIPACLLGRIARFMLIAIPIVAAT